jgi:uncharacterized protein
MMKFLLLIAVVFVVLSLMRGSRELRRRRDGSQGGRAAAPPPPAQQDMVECPVCHVHLPRTDALAAPDGQLYCSPEHRQLANRA